ncbi:ABC transporter permease subunit [Desulfofundulus thermobenzoicus]|uniref:ABC transporter permease subunit n=1 Tax=Desulfofundulus thermobenzoicus TaxID=29376 RepID=A0A6N7INB6_9FIRM|nr:amino acid ABC transporter permease [Desulfofundulus thermobenzoicus]MQL50818.1 ABC transporter permease subunit [Desulfofundulus thermobenzoicus]HHW44040.1 amino acid ABC transporter permease [Desulfotomaculum sp.]
METAISSLPVLLLGAVKTLEITAIAVFIGCILGLAAGLARLSRKRILRFLATCYVDFFRGTPLLVQIVIVYFGIPQILKDIQNQLVQAYGITPVFENIPIFVAAVIACSLNSGAYIAEIFRAGVQSIEKGQMEAARSLGMTHGQAMRYVILPQAFKRVIPPLGNEFIAMLKDTSLLSVIGFEELFRRGQLIVGATYKAFQIYLTVAFIYLIMVISFSRLVDYLERRLKTGD